MTKLEQQEKESIGYNAGEYSEVKNHGWRVWVETYTIWEAFRRVMSAMDGKTMVDAGCGTGLHARHMVEYLGARKVYGVDGDRGFIEQAKKESQAFGNAIEFRRSWIQDPKAAEEAEGTCDGGLASYLMSYPRNREEAEAYVRGLARFLKSGAPVVGFSNNHRQRTGGRQYKKYGFTKRHSADVVGNDSDGALVKWIIPGLNDPIKNYGLHESTYNHAFNDAGMGIAWSRVKLNPSQANDPHWKTFFEGEPPVIAWVAVKDWTNDQVRKLLEGPRHRSVLPQSAIWNEE